MKVVLFMAMSLNGIIARENNEEDFLSNIGWDVLCDLAKQYKSFIWGRKTYEVVQTWEKRYFTQEIEQAKKIIVSNQSNLNLASGYELASSPTAAIDKLSNYGFSTTVLTGGATLNSSFAKENLIDEVLLNIEPIVVGSGIPLFSPLKFDLPLKLISSKSIDGKVVQLKYSVEK